MIFLIRHGETELNAARVVQPPDTPLGERGIEQAKLLGERIEGLGVERVLTSSLRRARMTADAIVRATGAPLEETDLLHERSFGDHRGTPYAELGVDIFATDYQPPAGESWTAFDARVARAWAMIQGVLGETEGNLAVVTHGLVCRSLTTLAFDVGGADVPTRFGNTSLTVASSTPPHAVELLGCVAHLTGGAGDDAATVAGI